MDSGPQYRANGQPFVFLRQKAKTSRPGWREWHKACAYSSDTNSKRIVGCYAVVLGQIFQMFRWTIFFVLNWEKWVFVLEILWESLKIIVTKFHIKSTGFAQYQSSVQWIDPKQFYSTLHLCILFPPTISIFLNVQECHSSQTHWYCG